MLALLVLLVALLLISAALLPRPWRTVAIVAIAGIVGAVVSFRS